MNTNSDQPLVITPRQVEGWISGVSEVQIAPDNIVTVRYEDGSRISAKLEALPYAIQTNFFALVRRVQEAAGPRGVPASSLRLA